MLQLALSIIAVNIAFDLIISYIRNGKDYRKKFSFRKAVIKAAIIATVLIAGNFIL